MQPILRSARRKPARAWAIGAFTCFSIAILGLQASGCASGGNSSTGSGVGTGTGGNSGGGTSTSSTFSATVSPETLTLPAGGSIGRVTVTLAGSTDSSVTLSVTGLPAGATATVESQPGTSSSGTVAINPGTAVRGTYGLTITASDGTAETAVPLSLTLNSGTATSFVTPIQWSLSKPLINPVSDATHSIIAVKDPSVTYYDDQWQVMTSAVDSGGNYNMEYWHFPDWADAPGAKPYYMDETPGFSGYHTSPTLFYFAPQKKWYLISQSQPPQYSTTDNPMQPSTWTVPQNFYASMPSTIKGWIDFDVICDAKNCYLFFTDDQGGLYRASTPIGDFPKGFGPPQLVMQAAKAQDLFEGMQVYTLQGMNQYLMIVEAAQDQNWTRYFRAFILPSLDGPITPLPHANSWTEPFAGENNVSFASGVTPWTHDISHGDLVRINPDQTETVDPANLQFLIQGDDPNNGAPSYNFIPWHLGLLTRTN